MTVNNVCVRCGYLNIPNGISKPSSVENKEMPEEKVVKVKKPKKKA